MGIRDIQLLYKIKKILGVGTIDIIVRNNQKLVLYRIRNKTHLKLIVLPIFNKYPMFSNKQYDYLMFKELLLNEVKVFTDLNKYVIPLPKTILNKDYFKPWLIGFIEAKGNFNIYMEGNSKIATFDISQTNGSILIEAIKTELSLTPNCREGKDEGEASETNYFNLKVSSIRAVENIIKYIQNAPLQLKGYKRLQYLLWLKELRTIPRYANKFNIPNKY